MKPKHLRIGGIIFALALFWESYRYFSIRASLGWSIAGLGVIGFAIVEWLARKEKEKEDALERIERRMPRPPKRGTGPGPWTRSGSQPSPNR